MLPSNLAYTPALDRGVRAPVDKGHCLSQGRGDQGRSGQIKRGESLVIHTFVDNRSLNVDKQELEMVPRETSGSPDWDRIRSRGGEMIRDSSGSR